VNYIYRRNRLALVAEMAEWNTIGKRCSSRIDNARIPTSTIKETTTTTTTTTTKLSQPITYHSVKERCVHPIMIDSFVACIGVTMTHNTSLPSQSRTGRQGNLFAFYALRNGNSRRHNRHNLCLCDSGGSVLRQFCFEPLLSCLFLLYQARFHYKKDSSRYQLHIV
jgi:hypothetical protein